MIGLELPLNTLISPNWGIHHCLWHNDFNVLGDGHSIRIFFRRMSAVFIPMRRTMKKFNKVAMVLASAALATAAGAQSVDNWRNGTGELAWKNGTNEYCWRSANWTPATAAAGCDGAIVAPRAAAPAPAPAPAPGFFSALGSLAKQGITTARQQLAKKGGKKRKGSNKKRTRRAQNRK